MILAPSIVITGQWTPVTTLAPDSVGTTLTAPQIVKVSVDDSNFVTSSGGGGLGYRSAFQTNEEGITQLVVNASTNNYGPNQAAAHLHVWNFTTAEWSASLNTFAAGSKQSGSGTIETPADYINGTGLVYALLVEEPTQFQRAYDLYFISLTTTAPASGGSILKGPGYGAIQNGNDQDATEPGIYNI